MKKNIGLIGMLILSVAMTFFTSCSNDDTSPSVDTKAKYTLMLYGCGGATLDDAFFDNLKQAIAYGSTDEVKMTFEMKLSKAYTEKHDVGNMAGTFRMVLPERMDTAGIDLFKLPTEYVSDETLPLYDPQSLSDFIKWSVTTAPAENYILVVWNHGGGWNIIEDGVATRAILSDDNMTGKKSMSIKEFVEGVSTSGVRMKMLLTDACNMHTMETLFDYASVSDYCLGAVQTTPDYGTNYYNLMKHLNNAARKEGTFETEMRLFADEQPEYWFTHPLETDIDKIEYFGDMGLIDLRKLSGVASVVSDIVEELCNTYSTYHDAYDEASEQCHLLSPKRSENLGKYICSFDALDYFKRLAETSKNEKLKRLADSFAIELDKAQYRVTCKPPFRKWKDNVSVGIIITNKTLYEQLKYNDSYPLLEFDKHTGWSRWLKTNEHHPSGELNYLDMD